MLQQILEPGQKAGKKEEEEEKVGFWKKFTLLPGFGIMLAIGVVLIGQVSGNQIGQTGRDLQKTLEYVYAGNECGDKENGDATDYTPGFQVIKMSISQD